MSDVQFKPLETGIKYGVFTTKSDFTGVTVRLRSATGGAEEKGKTLKYRVMIIEYQNGMENWDIPFFTSMQSVRMPVLTTTGKNLFDTNAIPRMGSEYNDFTKAYATTIKPILNLKPNTIYQINGEITQMPNRNSVFKFVDNNGVEIQGTYVSMNKKMEVNLKKFKVNNKFTTGNNG